MSTCRAAVCGLVVFVLATGAAAAEMPQSYAVPGIEIGGFVTDDGGAGEFNVIVPLARRSPGELFFLGADGEFTGDHGAYDVGTYLGYRATVGDGVFGVWAGADRIETSLDNDFHRFIAGAEYYGSRVILRANGFVPFDDQSDPWTVSTGTIVTTYAEEIPSGLDAEAGLRLALPPVSAGLRPSELRAFAGVYDYFGLDADGSDVVGGRGRLELDLYPFAQSPDTRLSFEVAYAYDDVNDDRVRGGVRLSIPMTSSEPSRLDGSLKDDPVSAAPVASGTRDLFEPVRRNREAVSRVRTLSVVNTAPPPPPTPSFVLSMANACGGPGGTIPGMTTPVGAAFDTPFDGFRFDLGAMTVASGALSGQSLEAVVGSSALPANLSLIGTYTNGSTLTVRVKLRTRNGMCSASSEVSAAAVACTFADLADNLGITIDPNTGAGSDGCSYGDVAGNVVNGDTSSCSATVVACY